MIYFKLKYSAPLFVLFIVSVFYFSSCEKTKSCPAGNLCIEGNVLEYQSRPTAAKLIIDVPEGAVYANAAVIITDMVPYYPANADYTTLDRYFAGGMFRIEPADIAFKDFITLTIEYTTDGITDDIGDNFEDFLLLYYIDDDNNWSIVNASTVDKGKNTVSAKVTHLGTYAIAAPKDCIVGEWRIPGQLGSYDYSQSITFNVQGVGNWKHIVDCDSLDFELSYEQFSWQYKDDDLYLFNFSPWQGCGYTGPVSADMEIPFECDGNVLKLFSPSISYSRNQ